MISKEDLQKKISELEIQMSNFTQQAQAQINGFHGAIQTCKDLIASEEAKETTKES